LSSYKSIVYQNGLRMNANGPAIKCVNGAERIEAGAEKLNREIAPVPAESSEARRAFCRPGIEFD
jgi:hypothetical protein